MTINFAKRNLKKLLRDPLSIVFIIIFPLILLFIFNQFNIPSESYRLNNLTPAIVVFGFSFITMFSALLISKDRSSSFLIRLSVSPMQSYQYILGYILAIIPIIIVQNVLFFALAIVMGLKFSFGIIVAVFVSIVIAIPFICIGIIIGSIFSEKSSSGVSSILVQVVCFTSGMFFPVEILGGFFKVVCEYLPFESCVTILRGVMNNNLNMIGLRNIIVFAVYFVIFLIVAVLVFRKKMASDNKQ